MLNEEQTRVLREAMVEQVRSPELAASLMAWYQAMDDAAKREWMRAALGAEFDEKLMPQIRAAIKEEQDRAAVAGGYVRPDASAVQRMEKPLNERQLKRDAGTNECLREQQRFCDDLYLLRAMTPEHLLPSVMHTYLEESEAPEHIRTALDTTTSTGASQWIPTILSAEFYRLIEDQQVVAPLFRETVMRGKVIEIPTLAGVADVYLKTEGSAVTEDAAIKSGKVTFTAADFGTFRDWTDDLSEDSILNLLAEMPGCLAKGIGFGIDRVILNGDETGTHMDTTHAAIEHAWDGLRHQALVNAAGANADLSTWGGDAFNAIPAAMGKFADPRNLAIIVGNKTYWKRLPTTVDNGTNKNPVFLPGTFAGVGSAGGSVPFRIFWMGAPVIYSTQVREDIGATGVSEASANTYTYALVVNTECWRRGTRREVTVRFANSDAASIKAGTATMAATWRGDFNHMEAAASLTTAVAYKIS